MDDDRAGAAGGGNVEGFLDGPGQILCPAHQVVVLDYRHRHPQHIRFLKGIRPDLGGGHLPGHGHHRHGVHVSSG